MKNEGLRTIRKNAKKQVQSVSAGLDTAEIKIGNFFSRIQTGTRKSRIVWGSIATLALGGAAISVDKTVDHAFKAHDAVRYTPDQSTLPSAVEARRQKERDEHGKEEKWLLGFMGSAIVFLVSANGTRGPREPQLEAQPSQPGQLEPQHFVPNNLPAAE